MFEANSKRRSLAGRRARLGATLALTLGLAFGPPAQACTSFLLGTSDGAYVYGRTMEFGFELESRAMVIPRNYKLASTGPGGKPAMSWTGIYAAVGLNALGVSALVDSMNEKGLSGGILYFPDYAGPLRGAQLSSASHRHRQGRGATAP